MDPQDFRAAIAPLDPAVLAAARDRIDHLTKPLGSLGRIEELAVQLCGIAGGVPPHRYERRAILVGAGDHGVAAEGVSAYPPEVTAQMVGGFLAGFAAINAFARAVRADVVVANFGVREALPRHPDLLDVNVGYGTQNFAKRPAIKRDDLGYCIAAGIAAFDETMERAPYEVLALGEMGIANSTSAAAITAAFTGASPDAVVGRGTGIDDERLARKIAVVRAGLARCNDFTWEEIASEVGGYEIVGLAGVILCAARARMPIVLDGYIVAAAALIAGAIAPNALHYCIAAHPLARAGSRDSRCRPSACGRSSISSSAWAKRAAPALALPLVEAAARMVAEMHTFAEAGVATTDAAGEIVV